MSIKELFKKSYLNPTGTLVAPSSPEARVGIRDQFRSASIKVSFAGNENNIGGRHLLFGQHYRHKSALKQVKAVITEEMKPPHAFIDNCKNGNISYGDKIKRFRPVTSILTRKKQNIDTMLMQQEEFEEVRQTLKRVREIKKGGRSYMNKGCDTSPPKTLSLSKKLIENRRPN